MKAFVCVINDLNTDQRVHRTCTLLQEMGYEVTLVGRKLKKSSTMEERPYQCIRFNLVIEKGPLFYLLFNIRLLAYLLIQKAEMVVANDLDTLLSCYISHKLKKNTLVYDSHEYFTEVPELVNRPFVQHVWQRIESMVLRNLKSMITVNHSIARLYQAKYNIKVFVVRNTPTAFDYQTALNANSNHSEIQKEGKKLIILQGSGINIQRGAEEAVIAMKNIENAVLLIIGGGDVIDVLKVICKENELQDKVKFLPKMPYTKMMTYTVLADIALSLDKDTNVNYRYSLPNKLFDYIQARVPVVVSSLPEVKAIVNKYDIGVICSHVTPEIISKNITELFNDPTLLSVYKKNIERAAKELVWETEKNNLKEAILYELR